MSISEIYQHYKNNKMITLCAIFLFSLCSYVLIFKHGFIASPSNLFEYSLNIIMGFIFSSFLPIKLLIETYRKPK